MTQSEQDPLKPEPDPETMAKLPVGSGKRRKRLGSYKPTIREALLHNATLPEWQRLTAPQLAQRLGVVVQSVYVAASNMRGQGVLALKSARPPRDVPGSAAVVDSFKLAQDMADQEPPPLDDVNVMTKDERARKLSHIGRTAPAAVAVNAVTRLDEMERTSGITVGPPDPMTDQDRAERLARILMVCGPEVRKLAEAILSPPRVEPDTSDPPVTPEAT